MLWKTNVKKQQNSTKASQQHEDNNQHDDKHTKTKKISSLPVQDNADRERQDKSH